MNLLVLTAPQKEKKKEMKENRTGRIIIIAEIKRKASLIPICVHALALLQQILDHDNMWVCSRAELIPRGLRLDRPAAGGTLEVLFF